MRACAALRTLALLALALLALAFGLAACRGERPADEATSGAEALLRWRAGLPKLPADAIQPEPWPEARLRWRTATVALTRGDAEAAAKHFLAAAELLDCCADHPHAATVNAGRCMAYENAATAFGVRRDVKGAKTALQPRAERDRGCRASLELALERLMAEHRGDEDEDAPAEESPAPPE